MRSWTLVPAYLVLFGAGVTAAGVAGGQHVRETSTEHARTLQVPVHVLGESIIALLPKST